MVGMQGRDLQYQFGMWWNEARKAAATTSEVSLGNFFVEVWGCAAGHLVRQPVSRERLAQSGQECSIELHNHAAKADLHIGCGGQI
jgi:hypothetical protein